MRCAECGEKITSKPIRRGTRVFCSIDCADSAAQDKFEQDEDQGLDEELDDLEEDEGLDFDADTVDRYYGDEDEDR